MSLAFPRPAAPTPPPRPRSSWRSGGVAVDRVSSLIMAVVLGAMGVVAWLFRLSDDRGLCGAVRAAYEFIEVSGGGGGHPRAKSATPRRSTCRVRPRPTRPRTTRSTPPPSSNPRSGWPGRSCSTPWPPSPSSLPSPSWARLWPGRGRRHRPRASSIGTGIPGSATAPATAASAARTDGASFTSRADRRRIRPPARCPGSGAGHPFRAGFPGLRPNFSAPNPTRPIRPAAWDDRLYFVWEGRTARRPTRALPEGRRRRRRRAESPVLPQGCQRRLAQLETAYRGLRPSEIRVTRFRVAPVGNSYGFEVIDQKPL